MQQISSFLTKIRFYAENTPNIINEITIILCKESVNIIDMKLKNMPVPLNASLIDEYMGPILNAAKSGDLSLIKNIA